MSEKPRKRKDKKKKEDSDAGESVVSHPSGVQSMGPDDVQLHVHKDHGTGGHWCAKIVFFSLMAILAGLVGLIILENRGLSDVDTPLSESRFSEILEGWVDENRESHDDHDEHDVLASLEELDEHDGHDEPFEEEDEEDHDEAEEEDHDEAEDEGDDQGDEDEDEQEEDTADQEEEEEDEDDQNQPDNDDDDDDNVNDALEDEDDDDDGPLEELDNDADGDDDDDDNEDEQEENAEDQDQEEEDDDDQPGNDDDDDQQNNDDDDDDDQPDNDDNDALGDDDDDGPFEEHVNLNTNVPLIQKIDLTKKTEDIVVLPDLQVQIEAIANHLDDQKCQLDDDGSFEEVIDNDAGEDLHLRKMAQKDERQDEADDDDEEPASPSSSQIPPKSGAQSLEDDLQDANDQLDDNPSEALKAFNKILKTSLITPEAVYGKARALDKLSEIQQSNSLLKDAIRTYETVIELKEMVTDELFAEAATRCIDRMRFLGLHLKTIPIHEALIKRFNDNPEYRNQLAISYLLLNRLVDAKLVLHHTLLRWRHDPVALVHYGFVLKTLDRNYEEAADYLTEGILSNAPGTQDGRFYFALGDSLMRLGRMEKARAVFRAGAKKKLFLSEYQRSLYNVDSLVSKPFWTIDETRNGKLFQTLERNWHLIRDEGLKLLNQEGYFVSESENLREKGDWKQFDLFVQGQRIARNCQRAQLTCNIMESFPDARFCTRGQIKFSVMHPGTHVWPHCGPTNCRIRAHLGLKIPPGTSIRVAEETRSWREGQMLIFDDSFEHEVWHNGTSVRLILIVDIWHPDLTDAQRKSLHPI